MTRSNQAQTMTLHTYNPYSMSLPRQLPTPYDFRDIARTRFYRSRSLRQGQRSNQGHTMTLHPYTPLPMPLPIVLDCWYCLSILKYLSILAKYPNIDNVGYNINIGTYY